MDLCDETPAGGVNQKLSPQALDTLRSLDSLSYGLLDLNCFSGRASVSGGGGRESGHRPQVTRNLIKQGITHLRGSVAKLSYSPHSQAQLVSQIAHLHLLLDELTHAYSAYSQYRRLSPSSETDPALFYGLGIIHCRHGQHKQGEEAYTKVLSLAPSFPRSGEVHLQLGLLLKRRRAYDEATAHFEKALNKHDLQLDKFLVQFQVAHVLELQGHSSQARRKYEVLLGCRTLPPHVKALTQKQLGWLLHRCPRAVKAGEEGVSERALELLKQAAQSLPECGETWYLLGRLLVTQQKYHEAFAAYQKTIRHPSKISPANAWHSIGHLYFQMQQPRDSLQAYLCCVYLEIHHLQGWKSLGCLYEAVVYPVEALLCYQNALVAFGKKGTIIGKDVDYIRGRIDALNQYLSIVGAKPLAETPGMPLLHEAWTNLVPEHIRKRQPSPGTPLLSLNQCSNQLYSNSTASLMSYPPLPTPLTPINLGSMAGAVGNFPGPLSESKLLQKKKTKKFPVSRMSSGSTPSPPVFASPPHPTPTLTPPHNKNCTLLLPLGGASGVERRADPALSADRKPGTELDLNGINLDNLDFDALAAAASAIPSPASLAARSRVKVASNKEQDAAFSCQLKGGKPALCSSLSSHSLPYSDSSPLQTSVTHPPHPPRISPLQVSTGAASVHPQSLIPSLTSPPLSHRALSSSPLPFSALTSPTYPLTAHNIQPFNSGNPFSKCHSSSSVPGGLTLPLSSVQSVSMNSIHSPSGSHTPDTVSSHQLKAGFFNWPSHFAAAHQQANSSKPSRDPLQYQPLTTKPLTSSAVTSYSYLAPQVSSSVQSIAPQPSHNHPPVTSVSPTLPRSLSLTEGKGRRKSVDKTNAKKRRSSASSSSHLKNRRQSDSGVTNKLHLNPLLTSPPSIGLAGIQSSSNNLPPPLPPNMASDPTLLSQIQAASQRSVPRGGVFPGGLDRSVPSQANSAGGCTTNVVNFGLSGYNHTVPQVTAPQGGPWFGLSQNSAKQTAPLITTVAGGNLNGMLGQSATMTAVTNSQNSGPFGCSQMTAGFSTSTLVTPSYYQPPLFSTTMTNLSCGTYGRSHTTPTFTTTSSSVSTMFGHNQTLPLFSTGTDTHSGTSLATGGHKPTTPQTTTNSTTHSKELFSNTTAPNNDTHLVLKRSRLSSHTSDGPPANMPASSQSPVLPHNSTLLPLPTHQDHHHHKQHNSHRARRPSQSGKTGAKKTIHHFSPTTPNSSSSLPATMFECLPLFSPPLPPPPYPHQSPDTQALNNLTTYLPSSSFSAASVRDLKMEVGQHTSSSESQPQQLASSVPHQQPFQTQQQLTCLELQPAFITPQQLASSCSPNHHQHVSSSRVQPLASPSSQIQVPTSQVQHLAASPSSQMEISSHQVQLLSSRMQVSSSRVQPLASPSSQIQVPTSQVQHLAASPSSQMEISSQVQPLTSPSSQMQVTSSQLQSFSTSLHQAQQLAFQAQQLMHHFQRPPSHVHEAEQPTIMPINALSSIHRSCLQAQQHQQLLQKVERMPPATHHPHAHPSPEDGPTLTVLTSGETSNDLSSTTPDSTQLTVPPPPLASEQPATSVESLVNHLFAVLQEKNSGEPVVRSPSNSSSGVSSAETRISTFSTATAESSPTDPQSVPSLTSPSARPPQTPSSSSLHPSLEQHCETVSSPTSSSSSTPSSTLSPRSCTLPEPKLSFFSSSTLVRNGHRQTNEPLLYHNYQHYQPSNHNVRPDKLIAPRVPFPSLASLKEYMVLEPELRPPSPPPFHPRMELRPECPLYEVTSYEVALSPSLEEFCYDPSVPICLIRGLAEAVRLDLTLFSSQCLIETSAGHEMEVREQMKQAPDENSDVVSGKQVWKCESSKSITTVTEYARYQQRMLHKEIEEKQSVSMNGTEQGEEREFLGFGTNVDISDENIWLRQLQELNKLPKYLRVTCPETNLLSHIGHTVLGMNSVQLYMKVAGSRTPGHQENNNFCSVNINIGPGTCEWFAVPNCYWGVLHNLCEKHKVNFLVGSWWPVLEELHQLKVPVYRFTQYQGDLVFINPGTVHWVQANSTCNNIAWNTGPLTAHQFRMAWERYQWNKIQRVRSIVPMIHLTWNLARHIRVTDSHFYSQVRSLLESSLAQSNLLLSHLRKAGIPVVWHGRLDGEPAPYCHNCMEEVFNILFVLSHRGEYLAYCHRCASSMRKTFTVLQQYQTEELEDVVTSFRLHPPEL